MSGLGQAANYAEGLASFAGRGVREVCVSVSWVSDLGQAAK